MQVLLLSPAPAPARPPLPTLRRRSLSSAVASAPRVSATRRAAAFGRTTSDAAGRSSLPHLAAAAAGAAAAAAPPDPTPLSAEEEAERAKLAQVSKKLEKTARYFNSLGTLGFWSQLVCTTVSAGILSFSAVATGNATAPFTFCATAVGIVAAFISVFWSFGYIRLSERLRRTANEPAKAPPRAGVVKNLRNGIVLNVVGMGAAVLGMQATVGALVAKALTTSSVPYYQGIPPGQSPVLALDIFLVQASVNTILSHFLGLSTSLELLRSVTLPQAEAAPVPKPA
ncbi:protein TIC 21, chloroplastic-like [Phragmites australis]|uniref:protein TIC 21, chloroplastic-like n=1 Tax=Phragmites australis TaxID=29695 RepID=UPI002D79FC85|nr:protein TIC 21, chloroplastic-like [Phragmites australis]